MQTRTGETPSTISTAQASGTGPAAEASTYLYHPDELAEYQAANIDTLEADLGRAHACAASARAHARCVLANPYLDESQRQTIAATFQTNLEFWTQFAAELRKRLALLRPQAQVETSEPVAIIVISVQRDHIQQTAKLQMGGTSTVTRHWDRVGAHSFQSADRNDWAEFEERIGVELAEYMDGLGLPMKVADMLPRSPSADRNAAAKAAQEVRRG
jgi:hypothetical protein